MSSSAVAAPGGGGGVSWQADLPALASLVLGLGASSLKRFAEAGVDFHTVLCMGEIAEKCPASREYRVQLSKCRQEQRKQSLWFYKVVEIGAGTNFVVDELLKTRAGENIMALLSTILPIMNDATCDDVLLKLFEASGASLDKTPGLNQLRSLRDTMSPLARKLDFKDKTFEYFTLVRRLAFSKTGRTHEAHRAIPNAPTTVQVILCLFRLMQADASSIMTYEGLDGSGWVIAYARHVLGLRVCVMDSETSSVPISADFGDCQVIVNLSSVEDGSCKIATKGEVQDFFETGAQNEHPTCWSVDVFRNEVRKAYIPNDAPVKSRISIIVASMVKNLVEMFAQSLGAEDARPQTAEKDEKDPKAFLKSYANELMQGKGQYNPEEVARASQVEEDSQHQEEAQSEKLSQLGLRSFPLHCLPAALQRAGEFLILVGFDTLPETVGSDDWRQYFSDLDTTCHRYDYRPGPLWMRWGPQGTRETPKGLRFQETTKHYLEFAFRMIEAASHLAFTNWSEDIFVLSTRYLDYGSKLISGWPSSAARRPSKRRSRANPLTLDRLASATLSIVAMQDLHSIHAFRHDKLLACHYYGLVAFNAPASRIALPFDACYFRLWPGYIAVHGVRREKMIFATSGMDYGALESMPFKPLVGSYPINQWPALSTTGHVTIEGEFVVIKRYLMSGEQLIYEPRSSPPRLFNWLRHLLVTDPCEHQYYDPVTRADTAAVDDMWLHGVDENSPGQWVAYQRNVLEDTPMVLQRNCCLQCTLERCAPAKRVLMEVPRVLMNMDKGIAVIFGRREGEPMH